MVKPGYRQIHLLNFSCVEKQGEFWHEGEKRMLKNPKKPNFHHPYLVHFSVFDYLLKACPWNVCAAPWRLWDKFSETFYSPSLQRRQKPKTGIFQELLQTVWKFSRELWCKGWFSHMDIWAVLHGCLIPVLTCIKSTVVPFQTTAPRTITFPPCITTKSALLPKDWDGPQHSVTDAFWHVNSCLLGKDWSTIPLTF